MPVPWVFVSGWFKGFWAGPIHFQFPTGSVFHGGTCLSPDRGCTSTTGRSLPPDRPQGPLRGVVQLFQLEMHQGTHPSFTS